MMMKDNNEAYLSFAAGRWNMDERNIIAISTIINRLVNNMFANKT